MVLHHLEKQMAIIVIAAKMIAGKLIVSSVFASTLFEHKTINAKIYSHNREE